MAQLWVPAARSVVSAAPPSGPPASGTGHGRPAVGLPEPSESAPIYNALHEAFAAGCKPNRSHSDPASTNVEDEPHTDHEAPSGSPVTPQPPVSGDGHVPHVTATGSTLAGLREAISALRIASRAADTATGSHTMIPTPTDDHDAAMLDATHDLFDALDALLHRELRAVDPGENGNLTQLATIVREIRDLTFRAGLPVHEYGHGSAAH
jgi:hypothetical protein